MNACVLISPFGTFSSGGGDVTPNAVNWADMTVTNDTGFEQNAAQIISGIDASITIKCSLSSGGKVAWYKNGALITGYSAGSASIVVNSGDAVFLGVSALPTPATSGNYVSGTATVTNESDGAAILDTFAYAAQYVYSGGGGGGGGGPFP